MELVRQNFYHGSILLLQILLKKTSNYHFFPTTMFAHSPLCPKIALLLSGILCVFLFPSLLLMPLACQKGRCIWCINSVLSSCSFLFLSSTALYPFHSSAQPEQEQWSHVKCMYKAVFMYPFYSAWNQIRHWDDLTKTLHQFEVLTSVDSVFKYKQLQFTGGEKETLNFPNWNHLSPPCVSVFRSPGAAGHSTGTNNKWQTTKKSSEDPGAEKELLRWILWCSDSKCLDFGLESWCKMSHPVNLGLL